MAANDSALLEAWREGDREAGDALIRRYYDDVYRFVFKRLDGDPDGTRDVVQSTFEAAVRKRDAIASSFRAYLYTIARRSVGHRYREQAREPSPLSRSVPLDASASKRRRIEQEDLVARALRQLSDDQQLLLGLNRFEHLTAREIAEVLGTTTASINSKLVRAKNKLEAKVRELEGDTALRDSAIRHIDSWIESVHRRFESRIAAALGRDRESNEA